MSELGSGLAAFTTGSDNRSLTTRDSTHQGLCWVPGPDTAPVPRPRTCPAQEPNGRDPTPAGVMRKGPCVCSVAQSRATLCDPMDGSLPGSSVHGIFQASNCSALPFRFLLQGIFPTQGSNPRLLRLPHWQAGVFATAPPGKLLRELLRGGRLGAAPTWCDLLRAPGLSRVARGPYPDTPNT